MTEAQTAFLRRFVAALLIFVLTLTGVGRGSAVASVPHDMTITIGDIVVPFCHNDARDGTGLPGKPPLDCCDACVLLASIDLPPPTVLTSPMLLADVVEHNPSMTWIPVFARVRSPKQAQGPPTA